LLSLFLVKSIQAQNSDSGSPYKEETYENYSFSYLYKKVPIAYTSHGNAIELSNKVKLGNEISERGGAYTLDRAI
jgi:hypothetical protein